MLSKKSSSRPARFCSVALGDLWAAEGAGCVGSRQGAVEGDSSGWRGGGGGEEKEEERWRESRAGSGAGLNREMSPVFNMKSIKSSFSASLASDVEAAGETGLKKKSRLEHTLLIVGGDSSVSHKVSMSSWEGLALFCS